MRVMYIRRPRFLRRKPRGPKTVKTRILRFLTLMLLLVLALFSLFHFQIRPLIEDVALAKASNIMTELIDGSILQALATGELASYDQLIQFEKNEEGQITALKSDMSTLTVLRARLISQLTEDLRNFQSTEFGIPVGNLSGSPLLSGKGPEIPIRILSVGAVQSEFDNSFTSTAINQTIHRIVFKVSVEVQVLLPGGTATATVESTVNVAETVIVGAVPDSYTYFSQFDNAKEASESYFDYGAALENDSNQSE